MFLEKAELIQVTPCLLYPDKLRATAELSTDIGEILPYMNAEYSGVSFNPEAPILTMHREFRVIILYPERITVIKARNTTDALQIIEWIRGEINDIYRRRDEIRPDHKRTERPHPMLVYRLLPATNCGKCGEMTCLAFAVKLLAGQRRPAECIPLNNKDSAEIRKAVDNLLISTQTAPDS